MKEKLAATQASAILVVVSLIIGIGVGFVAAPTITGGPRTITQTVAGQTVTQTVTAAPAGPPNPYTNLKVGLIIPITPEDFSWNFAAVDSMKKLQAKLGFKLDIADNLFDGTKAEPTATAWAQQGYNIIFGQGIQYQDMFHKIAPQFKNTLFVCIDCFKIAENVYGVWLTLGEGGYLMGLLAGKMTKTNKIGLIGGGRVPSIWLGHEGFKRAAKSVNPAVTFLEQWMPFSWADVAGARSATEQMAAQGADIIFSSGDGVDVGVRQAAKARRLLVTTVYADGAKQDPSIHLSSIVVRWDVAYAAAITDYLTGTYQNKLIKVTVEDGAVDVGTFGTPVPEDLKKLVLEKRDAIKIQGGISVLPYIDASCFDKPEQAQCKV